MRRLLEWVLGDGYKLVRVRSWRPTWGQYGIEWPTMRVRSPGGHESTMSPVWDRARLVGLWTGNR